LTKNRISDIWNIGEEATDPEERDKYEIKHLYLNVTSTVKPGSHKQTVAFNGK
jgi:hypothetical protein